MQFSGISTNSRSVRPGDLFVCIKGANVDRHDFIPDAIANGAAALITARPVESSVPYVVVEDPDSIIEDLYRDFYHDPQNDLQLIGITGTDGKTSTTTIIQTLIGPERCGYIGTNGYSCAAFKGDTSNTTPGVESLYRILAEFRDAGCTYVSMETSSEAFFYGRLKNLTFECGGYTNVDSEHLNTHKTLENYVDCKKQLFRQVKGCSILNSSDAHYPEFIDACRRPLTYGYRPEDDLYIKDYAIHPDHTDITYVYEGKERQVTSPLVGRFNIENLACGLLVCLSMGFEFDQLIANLSKLFVDGRMDAIDSGMGFTCIVDYAHTPNGLRRLFEFTNTLEYNRLITVMGQAGERDASKRAKVGELLVRNSDIAILTYEDPRHEDIDSIIDMMIENVRDCDNYLRINDRHEAIEKAVEMARPGDIVMVLGKGNETYEKINDDVIYFNDVEEVNKAIAKRRETYQK